MTNVLATEAEVGAMHLPPEKHQGLWVTLDLGEKKGTGHPPELSEKARPHQHLDFGLTALEL